MTGGRRIMSAMTDQRTFTIEPRGPFPLEEVDNFGFGQRLDTRSDGIMRLAFCVDGYREQVGVAVRQDSDLVPCAVQGAGDLEVVKRGGTGALARSRRRGVRRGRRARPGGRPTPAGGAGLRPPLFYSPYEAAAWSIISARRPARPMSEVRRQLSEAHGTTFEVAGGGERVGAAPPPHGRPRRSRRLPRPGARMLRGCGQGSGRRSGQGWGTSTSCSDDCDPSIIRRADIAGGAAAPSANPVAGYS